jgi:hypothetical protein
MTSEQWVKSVFPDAAIRTCTDSWTTIYANGKQIGSGKTPGAAWNDAVRAIPSPPPTVSEP